MKDENIGNSLIVPIYINEKTVKLEKLRNWE